MLRRLIVCAALLWPLPAFSQNTSAPCDPPEPECLRALSADQIVLHYHPDVLGVGTVMRRFQKDGYRAMEVPDHRLSTLVVHAYMNTKGPLAFDEDQVLAGELSAVMRGAYDKFFGAPAPVN